MLPSSGTLFVVFGICTLKLTGSCVEPSDKKSCLLTAKSQRVETTSHVVKLYITDPNLMGFFPQCYSSKYIYFYDTDYVMYSGGLQHDMFVIHKF